MGGGGKAQIILRCRGYCEISSVCLTTYRSVHAAAKKSFSLSASQKTTYFHVGMSTIWGQHYLYKYQIPQIVDPQIFVQIVVINFHTKFQKNVEKISKFGSKNDKLEYF